MALDVIEQGTKERVREAFARAGISLRWASREWFGWHESTLDATLRSDTRELRDSELRRIAEGTGASLGWLKTGSDMMPEPFAGPRDLPVRSAAAVGGEVSMVEGELIARPAPLAGVPDAFAVRIADDRLSPRYRRNDMVYFHPRQTPQAEECVALQLGNGTYVIGILYTSNRDGITLRSLDPENYERYRGVLLVAREIGVLRA